MGAVAPGWAVAPGHLGHEPVGGNKNPVHHLPRKNKWRNSFGIKHYKRPLTQAFHTACHDGGHLEDILATRGGISNEHHGLGGIGDHGFEFVKVGHMTIHILGRTHGHDKIDVGQGIGHPGTRGDVLHPGRVVFAGEGILGVGAGR